MSCMAQSQRELDLHEWIWTNFQNAISDCLRRVTTSPPRTRRSSTSSQGSASEVTRQVASVPASPARARPRSRSPRPASTTRPRSRSPRPPPQQQQQANNSDSGSEVSDEGYRSLGNKLTVPNHHDGDDLPTGRNTRFRLYRSQSVFVQFNIIWPLVLASVKYIGWYCVISETKLLLFVVPSLWIIGTF